MLKFSLSQIPVGSEVTDAHVYLYFAQNNLDSGSEGFNVTAYRVYDNYTVNGGGGSGSKG